MFIKCEYAHSHPTLCGPLDCSPPGSFVHGIFPARILEWVAISSSKGVIKYILLQLLLECEYNKAEVRGRITAKVLQRALQSLYKIVSFILKNMV